MARKLPKAPRLLSLRCALIPCNKPEVGDALLGGGKHAGKARDSGMCPSVNLLQRLIVLVVNRVRHDFRLACSVDGDDLAVLDVIVGRTRRTNDDHG